MCRQDFQVHHAEQKLAVQHPKLQPGHALIKSAISREIAAVSCSTASCEKIPSSVGTAISVRSLSIESSATTFPRCKITTCEQTRSTVSSSCELNSTTLPRAASS